MGPECERGHAPDARRRCLEYCPRWVVRTSSEHTRVYSSLMGTIVKLKSRVVRPVTGPDDVRAGEQALPPHCHPTSSVCARMRRPEGHGRYCRASTIRLRYFRSLLFVDLVR
jgi:hypothetical protein